MSSPAATKTRFAVFGGGISGLTAAYRLTQLLPSADVRLFEAGNRLGGVLSTHKEDGLLIEQGADSFLNKLPHALELCQELGIDGELIPTNEQHRRALVWHEGSTHPVPEGFVVIRPSSMWAMLRSSLLSVRGKLRVLAEPWVPVPENIHDSDFDQSVADFATERLGEEVFERLVQPLLAGIYTADPYKLSLKSTMPDAIAALREHGSLYRAAVRQTVQKDQASSGARYASFVTPRSGLVHLVDTLTDRIGSERIQLNTPVLQVSQTADRQWQLRTASGNTENFDGVVVALPAPRAAEILDEVNAMLAGELRTIEYASSAVVCLTYNESDLAGPITGFGVVVPTVAQRSIVAASFSSMKFPGRAPDGQLLVRVFLGGAVQRELMERKDQELIQIAITEMQRMIGASAKPLSTDLVRWKEKMPQYHVGHSRRIERIEDAVGELPGLELAGNAYHGVGIPQCVQSGDEAARRLVDCTDRELDNPPP